ncbi:MAG: hypothetical protein H7255_15255 [Ramlibacter sp.]|nr:hypothetical protein [Ramlibacter sp.]
MSSWIYRRPVGGDAHLVAWLEVRLFAGGAVEVLPWIENGYLKVVAPTSKSATYTFALGGSQRFSSAIDLPNHCRTPLVSGAQLSHWIGTDPGITPKHDTNYLQDTALVPSYRGQVASSAAAVTGLMTTYAPLQLGNHSGVMGNAGYHPSIGLLPEWDVLYLTSTSPRAFAGVVVNAYSAGRYGIHFRDETTNRPFQFSKYPNLVIGGGNGVSGTGASTKDFYTPNASGTAPPVFSSSHQPSFGYLAYLITGRWYFMEEVQFTATLNFLKNTDWVRGFSDGVLSTSVGANTTRGAAWALRALAHAASATPDDDAPLRNEFLNSLKANVNYYHGVYVAQPNNSFGIVQPYTDYGTENVFMSAPWQENFFTAAVGYALSLEPAFDTGLTKLREFFAWKAQSIVGMLGGTSSKEFLFCDAGTYTAAVAPSDKPDWAGGTGPWYPDWGAAYLATMGKPNPGVAGDLRGTSGGSPDGATGYWANLTPAISYAVQHRAAGALVAYNRLTSAPSWALIEAAFNTDCVWGVRPLTAPPAWVPAPGTFVNLGTSTLASVRPNGWPGGDAGGPFANWSGAAYASGFSALGAIVFHGSGHLTAGSPVWAGVWCFDLDDLTMKGTNVPSAPLLENFSLYNSYGESTSAGTVGHSYTPHTYDGLLYQPPSVGGGPKGSLLRASFAGSRFGTPLHRFDLSSTTAPPTRPLNALGGNSYPQSAVDEGRGGFWYLSGNGNGPLKFVKFSDWSVTPYPGVEYNEYGDQSLIYIPTLDCLVGLGRSGTGGGNMSVYVCPFVANVPQGFTAVKISGTRPTDARCGGCWSTILEKIVSYQAGGSYVVHMLTPPTGSLTTGTWAWTSTTMTGAASAVPSRNPLADNGAWGRMIEVPAARCFIWCDSVSQVPQAWRLPGM